MFLLLFTLLYIYNVYAFFAINGKNRNFIKENYCNLNNPIILTKSEEIRNILLQNYNNSIVIKDTELNSSACLIEDDFSYEILSKIHKNIIQYNLLLALNNNNISNIVKLQLIENYSGKKTTDGINLLNGGLYNDWNFIL